MLLLSSLLINVGAVVTIDLPLEILKSCMTLWSMLLLEGSRDSV